nr:PREDICTED: alpha-tocopherol transfer protein-like isoform X1 [Bemisia tabaci]
MSSKNSKVLKVNSKPSQVCSGEMINYTDEHVAIIRKWLEEEPNLPGDFEEAMIKRFLHCCSNDIERTKKVMKLFFNCRLNFKEFFGNVDFHSDQVQRILTAIDTLPLPRRTKEGYQVYVTRLRDTNPDNFNLADYSKMFFMMHDTRMRTEDIPAGDVPILDMEGFSFKHLTKLIFNFGTLKKYLLYNQEAHPVKLMQVHIVNTNGLLHKAFSLVKPLLNPHVKDMLHFHTPGSDTIDEFVPKDLLPKEYGGNTGSVDELKEIWVKKIKEQAEWLAIEDRWKEIPPEKLNKQIDLEQSFSKIEFD